MLDNDMSDQTADLAPHKNILDPNNPRTLTGAASMPKPVASTISNYIRMDRTNPPNANQIAFLEALAA